MKHVLTNHSTLLESFFCMNRQNALTADYIQGLFTSVKFSEKGSNECEKEEEAYMFFIDYMDECSPDDPPTLGNVLSFFTGEDIVPPMGYESVTLNFNKDNIYLTASTCAIELTIPTRHNDFYTFKKHMDIAFTMNGGFGLA